MNRENQNLNGRTPVSKKTQIIAFFGGRKDARRDALPQKEGSPQEAWHLVLLLLLAILLGAIFWLSLRRIF